MLPDADFLNCAIKTHHQTREAAQAVIDRWPEDYEGCHVYRCPECGGWLVGHKMRAWRVPAEATA